MKNRKSVQAILLIVVLALWGTIAYNILNYQDGLSTDPTYRIREEAISLEPPASPTQFDLILDYRDPFLGKTATRRSPTSPSSSRKTSTVKIRELPLTSSPAIKRPKIIYRGYILNGQRVTSVRLDVDGQSGTYRSSADGFQIIAMSRDSIVVAFHDGVTKVVYRKR